VYYLLFLDDEYYKPFFAKVYGAFNGFVVSFVAFYLSEIIK
jgi:hypothetical protein